MSAVRKAYAVHMTGREVRLTHSYSEFVSQDAQAQHSTAATGRPSFTRIKQNVELEKGTKCLSVNHYQRTEANAKSLPACWLACFCFLQKMKLGHSQHTHVWSESQHLHLYCSSQVVSRGDERGQKWPRLRLCVSGVAVYLFPVQNSQMSRGFSHTITKCFDKADKLRPNGISALG